jgi:hypothetical protein
MNTHPSFEEKRAKARAAVIARLAAKLLPRAPRPPRKPEPPPASPYVVADVRPVRVEPQESRVPVPMPEAPPDGWARVEAVPVMKAEGWRGACQAINPDTGRRCCLIAGHVAPHRHGRTAFVVAAATGQTHFPRAAALTAAATARHAVDARES